MWIPVFAVRVLLVAVGVAGWGETAPAPIGSEGWPGAAEEDPKLGPGLGKTGRVTEGYVYVEDDDYSFEELTSESPARSVAPGPMTKCDYDPCAPSEAPCAELQRASPCLCPGISGEDVVPEQPRVRQVSRVTGSSARVHWCEPLSAVDGYRLVYWPLESVANASTGRLPAHSRAFTLQGLTPGTGYLACAVATNRAGESRVGQGDAGSPSGFGPCVAFTTGGSHSLTLCLALAVAALLVVAVATGLLLRLSCARRRRPESLEPPVGLQNPTYEGDKVGNPQS
ncbi:LRRN4 C-terminal-like protein [Cetorhinus maximus]